MPHLPRSHADLPKSVTIQQVREFLASLGFSDLKGISGFEADIRTIRVKRLSLDAEGKTFATPEGVAMDVITIPIERGGDR